jgi:rhodanese-related sulfurtransferase
MKSEPLPAASATAPALEVNIRTSRGIRLTLASRTRSPTTIKGLLKIGYPAHKILWYRGGMQDWKSLGLTTLKPADN